MKLPHASAALVDREKITEYLLNREHPDNGGKADFSSPWGSALTNGQPSPKRYNGSRLRQTSL